MISRIGIKNITTQKEDIQTKCIGIQVNPQGGSFTAAEIAECEKDKVIPWDDPSLRIPFCSWSSFPVEPSNSLKLLVDFFTPPDEKDD